MQLMKVLVLQSAIISCCFLINAQDIMYKVDGSQIEMNVIEISIETIKYKSWNQLDGPLRTIAIKDVFMIIYNDGTKEVFKKDNLTKPIIRNNNVSGFDNKIQSMSNDHDLCFNGQIDATRYYSGYREASSGTAAATIIGGPIIGLIPAIACSTTEPQRRNLTIPEVELAKNQFYYSCYLQEAKKI